MVMQQVPKVMLPMAKILDYSTAESRSRPWLKALFIFAGVLAVFPLGLGLLGLFYGLVIRMEGARDVLRMGVLLVGASIVWVFGLLWLYHKVMPPRQWTDPAERPM